MVTPKNHEFYLESKTALLQKLESVIDKLIFKADKAEGKHKTILQHHVIKIQVKKARTDVILRKLKRKEHKDKEQLKDSLEISLKDLKKAFSNSISMT